MGAWAAGFMAAGVTASYIESRQMARYNRRLQAHNNRINMQNMILQQNVADANELLTNEDLARAEGAIRANTVETQAAARVAIASVGGGGGSADAVLQSYAQSAERATIEAGRQRRIEQGQAGMKRESLRLRTAGDLSHQWYRAPSLLAAAAGGGAQTILAYNT